MADEIYWFPMIAIVAIVAIVAMVVLIVSGPAIQSPPMVLTDYAGARTAYYPPIGDEEGGGTTPQPIQPRPAPTPSPGQTTWPAPQP